MNAALLSSAALRSRLAELAQTLRHWPWFDTLRTLRERFREDRLGLTAGSLTFTTLIALVPMLTVMLALFSAFPMFGKFQQALQEFFLQNLVPDGIARPVLATLTQFAAKAKRLGGLGLVLLGVTALAMMLTIDRTLNAIWRVRKPRPIAQRVLVYWAALTLGPLVLGVSMSLTSVVLSASRGLINALPGGLGLVLDVLQFVLFAAAVTALFHHVPNTHVRWRHALAGGLFVAMGFELAKIGLAWYVATVPGLATVYGAFATLPILLLWIYLGWVIMLLGAVIAAYAPSLQLRVVRHADAPGARFALCLGVLSQLHAARTAGRAGMSVHEVAQALRTDPLQVEPAMEQLAALDWVGTLQEAGEQRMVLLCEPAQTRLQPLADALLLQPGVASQRFSSSAGIERMLLTDVLS